MRRKSFLGLHANGFHRVVYYEWGAANAGRTAVCVHGLTRTGRDFDALAETLAGRGWRVVCPDMPGRGQSDWLDQPAAYDFAQYLADMTALIARLDVAAVDWIGTSMGGMIGLFLAARPGTPLHRLVLNDVGAHLPKAGLERIRGYVGVDEQFTARAEAEARLKVLLANFGPLSPSQFAHLAEHSLVPLDGGAVRFHYDPAIGAAMRATEAADIDLWPVWETVRCPVLLLRGESSDILPAAVAEAMTRRGPTCRLHTIADTGHAPALMAADQTALIADWLAGENI